MMTKQQATKLADLLNGELKQRVSDDVFRALGVRTTFLASVENSCDNYYPVASEERIYGYSATRAQLTATPLLCAMFEDAELGIRFTHNSNVNKLVGEVDVYFKRTNNDTNGFANIARFVIDLNDIEY